MKQIKAHIAVSLDGFIATSDNELEWLPNEIKSILNEQYAIAASMRGTGIPKRGTGKTTL